MCKETKDSSHMVINHTTPVKVHYKDICKVCAGKKSKVVSALRKQFPYPSEGYQCPICLRVVNKYYLDHDWVSGEFRGWLCNGCNVALGLLKDDVDMLFRAASYLRGNEKQTKQPYNT
jgi:transcription initiation factor IIE alpha subunit